MHQVETKDVDEAAYLWCTMGMSFLQLSKRARSNHKGCTIYFTFCCTLPIEEVDRLRRAFYNREALVEPKLFAERQVDIRNLLHEGLREGS